MKHCKRAKHGVPTKRMMKHVERGNFPMILYRIAKNLLLKVHCKDLVKLSRLWVRKGKPTDKGINLGGMGGIL